MTSRSSGYVTVRRNLSSSNVGFLKRNVSVPPGLTVFVSYRETVLPEVNVALYRYHMKLDRDAGRDIEIKSLVWKRCSDYKSDFLHVFQATKLSVSLETGQCVSTYCFKLFFSFLHPRRTLEKLPSGLWNCSVNYYSSIHHHVDCNHKTECEDGRDETEHCPFSSPECQGLVALCNRCYQFVKGLEVFRHSEEENALKMGNEYCHSLGATLSFPKCAYDWYHAFLSTTKFHSERFDYIVTGFYSNDLSLPSLYRQAILNDNTVLYHSFDMRFQFGLPPMIRHDGVSKCYVVRDKTLIAPECFVDGESWINDGLSCEFPVNKTEGHSPRLQTVSFANIRFPLPPEQHSMTVCAGGQVTHTFLICGSNRYKICTQEQASSCDVSDKISLYDKLYSTNFYTSTLPTFTCGDEFTLSYTVVCDFIIDCHDKSDESVCRYPVCLNSFTCASGQCLSYDKVCDQISSCYDESDETNCDQFVLLSSFHRKTPFPVLVNFDSVREFISVPLNSNDSCPDSHYRCPGDFNDCLPVFTRCNGMYDCLDHQDEEGCEDLTCPGFFRCRVTTICVHNDDLCDGWSHCPLHDDELLCNVACPADCVCQGHTFLCFQPFSATLFPQLRYLDATGSGMTLSDVNNHDHLFHLILARCSLTLLPHLMLSNLRILDLSNNQFQNVNVTSLLGLGNLYTLSLSKNPLTSIYFDTEVGSQQHTLQNIDMSYTSMTMYHARLFQSFPSLQKLNLTSSSIHTVSPGGFQFMQQLTELYMGGSPVTTFPRDIFKGLNHLRVIVTDNYKLCCEEILPHNFHRAACQAPDNKISSCKDLLQSWTYRGFLWLIACLSVTGNAFCFCARFFAKSMSSSSGFSMFVINLTMADFLMGVYITIIGIADEQFRGTYLHHDSTWKSSVMCKVAGVVSLLSSEVSALIIWIITLDRFVVLRFPFSTLRFDRSSAAVACLLIWTVGWFLALVPLLPVTSHWNFYGQTGICIPLPVTTQAFKGRWYSFSLLVGFNFILFLFISAGQAIIYWSIQNSTLKTNTTKVSQDMTIARRLITVAVTDFLCWFPIGICGLLALAGIPIHGEVNVALAIFVLPLNSAVNPFMYTFNTLAEKRKKLNEAKLLQWLESHADLMVK